MIAVMAAARASGLPLPAGGMCYSPWLDLVRACLPACLRALVPLSPLPF